MSGTLARITQGRTKCREGKGGASLQNIVRESPPKISKKSGNGKRGKKTEGRQADAPIINKRIREPGDPSPLGPGSNKPKNQPKSAEP